MYRYNVIVLIKIRVLINIVLTLVSLNSVTSDGCSVEFQKRLNTQTFIIYYR